MSLYADYIQERTNDLIKECQGGFCTYRYLNETEVYIVDIFVIPEMRQTGLASNLADEVVKEAKEKGCTTLIGSVSPSCKGSTISMKVLLGYGMLLHSAGQDYILFKKLI